MLLLPLLLLLAIGASRAADVDGRGRRGRTLGRNVVGIHECGWGQNWHAEGGIAHYRWPMITEVCASSYVTLYANGSVVFDVCGRGDNFQHAEYPAMREQARQHGVRWTFNLAVSGMTSAALTIFLGDQATRAAAVAGLVRVLRAEHADGLMLDFEGAFEWSDSLAPQLLGWFAELRAALGRTTQHCQGSRPTSTRAPPATRGHCWPAAQ